MITPLLFVSLLLGVEVAAADLRVTTFNDEFGEGPAACSLREAIEAAYRNTPFGGCGGGEAGIVDNIYLAPGFHQLTRNGGAELANSSHDLDIFSDLNITGAGQAATVILWSRAGSFDRILQINGATVRLSSLSMVRGDAGVGNGGGIWIKGGASLTLDQVTIQENRAANGGGIYNDASNLIIQNSTMRDNIAQGNGGGIYNTGSLTIETSTINGNEALGHGGGIWMGSASNGTLITNATFYRNQADINGGGIYVDGGRASLNFVTLTRNVADRDGDPDDPPNGWGGGVYLQSGGFAMARSILAGNTVASDPETRGVDCAGSRITSSGYNILGLINGCSIDVNPTDIIGNPAPINPFSSEPLLENNGGPTQTVSLPANSIAINVGVAAGDVGEDQRGVTRDNRPDSGAYEVVCGDGDIAGNEECDDGDANSDTLAGACRTTCVDAACGDSVVDAGEGCDDGNAIDTDGCRNICALPTCRDGVVQAGEDCDDGNRDNTDSCLDTCVATSCGDGFVQAGVEACDGDGCLDDCSGLIVAAGGGTAPSGGDGGTGSDGGGTAPGGDDGGGSGGGSSGGGSGGGCSLIIPKANSPR